MTIQGKILVALLFGMLVFIGAYFYPKQQPEGPKQKKTAVVTTELGIAVDIPVNNNTLEYDVKLQFKKPPRGSASLLVKYFIDGASREWTIEADQIPALVKEISTKNIQLETLPLQEAYLQYGKGSLLLFVKQDTKGFRIYDIVLSNQKVHEIQLLPGKPSKLWYSQGNRFTAFSILERNTKESSKLYLLRVLDNSMQIADNKTKNGLPIGNREGEILGYDVEGWYTKTVLKLAEIKRSMQNPSQVSTKQVLYDVENNQFVNADLSLVTPAKNEAFPTPQGMVSPSPMVTLLERQKGAIHTQSGIKNDLSGFSPTPLPSHTKESETMRVVRNIMLQMKQSKFDAVYDSFADEFRIDLFGIRSTEPVKKSQIDRNSFATLYGQRAKDSTLKQIIKEETKGELVEVTFTQMYLSSDGTMAEYPLVMALKKQNNTWKIYELRDAK